jgi:hypothetical protein
LSTINNPLFNAFSLAWLGKRLGKMREMREMGKRKVFLFP